MNKAEIQNYIRHINDKLNSLNIETNVFPFRMYIYNRTHPEYLITISFSFNKIVITIIKSKLTTLYKEYITKNNIYTDIDLLIEKINISYKDICGISLLEMGG